MALLDTTKNSYMRWFFPCFIKKNQDKQQIFNTGLMLKQKNQIPWLIQKCSHEKYQWNLIGYIDCGESKIRLYQLNLSRVSTGFLKFYFVTYLRILWKKKLWFDVIEIFFSFEKHIKLQFFSLSKPCYRCLFNVKNLWQDSIFVIMRRKNAWS